ncbi:cupin domain-containing protein [Marichromatium sp. AB32]|uniref:cupin domain-containing protein n=1 Tax=Marichromatium sp. AB32 TaxID=2483363 RepID=UPI000F418994|nr:cupin domain-containing protein [Marichromatium sp. AB32]RNE94363.1 cupin domain-containing protein [Marichromatium sp. AB32]
MSGAGNLLDDLRPPVEGERFETLFARPGARIERIVSSATPEPVDYDQPHDEWVCLLQGEAVLWIDGERVRLRAGDYRLIPAQTPHRVESTSTEPACVWLAVHVGTS